MHTSLRSFQKNLTELEAEYISALRESDQIINELTQTVDKFVIDRQKIVDKKDDYNWFQEKFFNPTLTAARIDIVAKPLNVNLKALVPLLNALQFEDLISYIKTAIRLNKNLTDLHKAGEGELQPILNKALERLLVKHSTINTYIYREAKTTLGGIEGIVFKQTIEIAANEFRQSIEVATDNFMSWTSGFFNKD